jgi:aryl-alcohol dehydrogenase-like predicted oxidoreductase
MKIALGTVQFGLKYGAFNKGGQVAEAEAAAILDGALAAGIDTLDTAQAYGESEKVLGRLGAAGRFRIISKCPPLEDHPDVASRLRRALDGSLANLGSEKLAGFLLHRAEDFLGPQGDRIWRVLEGLQSEGQIESIGVSGYSAATVQEISARYPIDIAQLPANVLDPWYEDTRFSQRLALHVRSVFLQGFLLSDPAALSPFHQQWRSVLEAFRARAAVHGLSPLQAALAPLLASPNINRLVLGVDSAAQLAEITAAAAQAGAVRLGRFANTGPALLDPRKWPQ